MAVHKPSQKMATSIIWKIWLLLLLWTQRSVASVCDSSTNLPKLHYNISPKFVWFPKVVNLREVMHQFIASSPAFSESTINGESNQLKTTLKDFLNSPCQVDIVVETKTTTSPQQAMMLLNLTMASTDLLFRLATHKMGKTYQPAPHTVISSQVHATLEGGRARTKLVKRGPKMAQLSNSARDESRLASIGYTISCPTSAGPVAMTQAEIEALEDVKGLAQARDCEWCQRAVSELQAVCDAKGGPAQILNKFIADRQWTYGGAKCESCS